MAGVKRDEERSSGFAGLMTDGMDLPAGLTGRTCVLLEAERAIARFARHGRSSALLLFEIDQLKSHPAGDLVVRGICTKLARLVRKSDVLGRLGWAEFGILLTEARPGEAVQAAERFRRSIEGFAVEHAAPLRVTASFGAADVRDDFLSAEDWLAEAHRGVYAARQAGGNRTCMATHS